MEIVNTLVEILKKIRKKLITIVIPGEKKGNILYRGIATLRGEITLHNIILFWFIIFGLIYIFTKDEKVEEEVDEKQEEEDILEVPCRRGEIASLLKDGLKEDEKKLELKRFKHRCFNCESEENLEFDHHLPLSRGYPLKSHDTGSNTVVLCRRCNREKGNQLPEDYYSREKLRKLEEMGIRSHLYYSPARIIEIERVLIGKKLERLEKAIEMGIPVTFVYYDLSKIMFLREDIEDIPARVYSRRRIEKYTSGWEWYLEGRSGRIYNISWIYRLGILGEKNLCCYNEIKGLKSTWR